MVMDIGLLLLLVLLNGVFASTELALVASKRGRLEQRVEADDRGAAAALRLQAHPTRLLSTVQIGITLIGTLAGHSAGPAPPNVSPHCWSHCPLSVLLPRAWRLSVWYS